MAAQVSDPPLPVQLDASALEGGETPHRPPPWGGVGAVLHGLALDRFGLVGMAWPSTVLA